MLEQKKFGFTTQKLVSLAVLLFAIFGFVVEAKSAKGSVQITNENIQRSIDLTGQLVREKRAISFSIGSGSANNDDLLEYQLTVEQLPQQHQNQTAAFITAKQKDHNDQLAVQYKSVQVLNGRHLTHYAIQVKQQQQSEEVAVVLVVEIVYAHALQAYPAQIAQNQRQLLVWYGNAYCPSVYDTKRQKTKLLLASSQVEDYTASLGNGGAVEKNGKTLTLGPFEQVAAEQFELFKVHFQSSAAVLTVESLQRELWVSHWGSVVSVEEWYNLRHDGARLKGQFSRVDFALSAMQHHQTAVVKQLVVDLPARAREVYFRDDIGNVSTSNFKPAQSRKSKNSVLELRPRYPLFGGWRYAWYHGYQVPIEDFVSLMDDGTGQRHLLEVPLIKGPSDLVYDNVTVRVVLPEGASDVRVDGLPPHANMTEWRTVTQTYLDTVGRPTVWLRGSWLVDEHSQMTDGDSSGGLVISYVYEGPSYWRKPVVLSGAMLLCFFVSMLYWRTNLDIVRSTGAIANGKQKTQ